MRYVRGKAGGIAERCFAAGTAQRAIDVPTIGHNMVQMVRQAQQLSQRSFMHWGRHRIISMILPTALASWRTS